MDAWLRKASAEIENTTSGMSSEDLLRSPAGKWNAGQILEHLRLTFTETVKVLSEFDPVRPSRPALMQRIAKFVVVTCGYLPSGHSAPAAVVPGDTVGSVTAILTELGRMETAIADAEKKYGPKLPLASHFAFGPLTASQWRKFHYVHTRHHMKQICERRGTSILSVAARQ